MKTITAGDADEFDIRATPIWTIPQLRWLMNRKGFTVVRFESVPNSGAGWVHVHIEGEGLYHGILKKENMNSPGAIPLTFGSW